MTSAHLHTELARNEDFDKVLASTQFGPVRGGRVSNGTAVWLEVPYALPAGRFKDPVPLPHDFRYEDKEFITESSFASQPLIDGQSRGLHLQDKLGFGKPTEFPFFLNIFSPPAFPAVKRLPVKVFIHGGFLQFGSPHGPGFRSQSISARNNEVWVMIAYRLSAFGFLASDKPLIEGNYGFKDQWAALLWVKDNIDTFGGNPDDIQLCGVSAGAYSVHQLMHHASHLPPGINPPFTSAFLQSNSIIYAPKPLPQLRSQFRALCKVLKLDVSTPDILETLSDPEKVPASAITAAIDSGKLGKYGTFRPSADGPFAQHTMTWQRSGEFGRKLKEKGIRSVIIGEVCDEWFGYSFAHPIQGFGDVRLNIERYYPDEFTETLLKHYKEGPRGRDDQKRAVRFFGRVLSDGQVHLPVRILHRDLVKAGVPVLRYDIRWIPQSLSAMTNGNVTHTSDRVIWGYLQHFFTSDETKVVNNWLDVFSKELKDLEAVKSNRGVVDVLTFNNDGSAAWLKDRRWNELMNQLRLILPGEAEVEMEDRFTPRL